MFRSVAKTVSRTNHALVKKHQTRRFNIHEYQSMEIMSKFGIKTPHCKVANSAEEAEAVASDMSAQGVSMDDFVVKAQVLAGGRGKGHFSNGFKGGVHSANSPLEVSAIANKMIGNRLITKQTGEEGKPCNQVLISERLFLRRETYFAILLDREAGGPVMVASPQGGMDIEAVARDNPSAIFKEPVDINEGLKQEQVLRLAKACGFKKESTIKEACENMTNLYQLFIQSDASLCEVNPMAETHDGHVMCIDAKLNFDSNAFYRQKEILSLRDESQEDPREVSAEKCGLNYIGLDGDIGCLVNGAGLAMATMDVIKLYGGEPANFLDLGGGATAEQVTEAFKILNDDPKVRGILVNIFGGIMRCDVIALGLIQAVNELDLKKPLVVRLAGTNVEEARKLIDDSGLRMIFSDNMADAAEKAVRIVDITKLAEDASVGVQFHLPL